MATRLMAVLRSGGGVSRSVSGATAVEYAIMLGASAAVIVFVVGAMGVATESALCLPVEALGGPAGC